MDAPNPKIAELDQLLWQMRDGAIDDDGLTRIETLVTGDAEVRRFYIRYSTLCGGLRWLNAGEVGQGMVGKERGMAGSPAIDVSVGAAVEPPSGQWSRTPNPEPPFPALSTTNYPLPTTPFVGSWAFSYMVATVIMGVAILGFWAYKITHHQHIAEAPSQSAPSEAMQEMVFVGRITGMVDVKWSDDPRYLPPPGFAHVPLGRKYILDSGLMEITYDSGAKVILEGPCTYEVESTAGGYLSLGKLTARVEEDKETRRQGDKENKANAASPHLLVSQSPGLPVSPLFSVRTPTAVITDLGTEFGVEVGEEGATTSRVFRGLVKVQVVSDEGRGQDVVLRENESARVERAKGTEQMSIIRYAAGKAPSGFVRAMPRPKPAEIVRIVEKFTDAKLGAAFDQMPPGRYAIVPGAAVYQQPPTGDFKESRGYIRTAATDFCDRDFVFEATFQMHLDGPAHVPGTPAPHHIFFGLGDGVPNADYWDVVACGLVLDFVADEGRAFMRFCHPDSAVEGRGDLGRTVAEVVPLGGLGSGRHRFRMSKTGKSVRFAVDADFQGEFQPDFVSRPIHLLAAGPPLLNATNSRLLVGTGNCDTMTVRFEELSITYLKTEKGGPAMNGP